jgi:hypothetical protein
MKFDDVTQWVIAYRGNPTRSKPSQRVSSKIHGQTRRRESEAGCSKAAGCVIEPRNRAHGGHRISSGNRTKADALHVAEGQQSCVCYGECAEHYRGLRPRHAFKGVARELGLRLVEPTPRRGDPNVSLC